MERRGLPAFIAGLENSEVPWGYWAATFLGLVTARNLLEGAFGPGRVLGFTYFASPSALMVLDHFLLFYVSVFLALSLVLSALARQSVGRVMKAMTPAWAIVLLPPLIDFLVTGGEGMRITYVLDLQSIVLRFFDPRAAIERVSPGQRVEILLACHLAMLYVRIKTRSWPRAIGAFFAVYLVVAAHGVLPSAFARLGWLLSERAPTVAATMYDAAFKSGGMIVEETRKLAVLFLASSCALGWAVFRKHAPAKARAVWANVRPLRSLHYVGMTAFGLALVWAIFVPTGVKLGGAGDWLAIVATFASTFLAFQASVLVNDIFDLETDRLAERRRPLPSGSLERSGAVLLAAVFAGTALLFALNVKYATFLVVVLALIVSFLYSVPPLRLKRIPLVSTMTLGFASLLAVLIGFSVLAEERTFALFPPRLAWLLVLSFGFAFVAKDLKDADGDGATGTLTIPTLLGPAAGRAVIAALVLLGYLLVPALLPYRGLGLVAIAAGALSAALVYRWRRPRVDEVLLAIYLAFALVAAIVVVRNVDAISDGNDPFIEAKSMQLAARRARAAGDRVAAASGYAGAAFCFPDDPRLLELAGVSFVESGDAHAARGFLAASLEADPSSPVAREYLAAAEAAEGRTDEAKEIMLEAVGQGVRPGVFLARLGELDLASGDAVTAAARYADALRVGRPDVPVRIRLGDALLAAGDAAAARREYEEVVRRRPSSPEAHDALGRILHAAVDLDAALDELHTATGLAPGVAIYWNNLAVVYRDLGRHRDALEALATATELDPTLVDPYYNRGRILDALGRHEEARRQYLVALEIDPSFLPARTALERSAAGAAVSD